MSQKNSQVRSTLSWFCLSLSVTSSLASGDEIRLNQIQVIGTHNSYHVAPHESVMKLIADKSPDVARSLDYTHRPLQEQLSRLGIRKLELDIFADPEGGLFADPRGTKMAADAGPDHDPDGQLMKPGMKVLHVPEFDYRTRALTLVQALEQVRAWSRTNRGHCPVMIMIEIKQDSIGKEYTQPHPFGPAEYDAIDKEILSVFEPIDIIRPDDVRGDFDTLREAITTRGWPLLDDVRGKMIFALDNGGEVRDAYLEGHPALRNRLLFVSVDEHHPAAAFMKINDPVGQFDTIQRVVRAGFLVRTRADAGTSESRLNDTSRRDLALASGAQYVSTDYPEPDLRFSEYQVRFQKQIVVRGNPVNAAAKWALREFDPCGQSWSDSAAPVRKRELAQ